MNRANGNQPSPLVAIEQKELELAGRLATAQAATERAILETRRWAADARERAEREGREAAARFYRAELDAIDAEAQSVCAESERVAIEIAERGARALDQAAQRILAIVLPRLNDE